MGEVLRELVVALSLDSDNFSRKPAYHQQTNQGSREHLQPCRGWRRQVEKTIKGFVS